MSVARSSDEGSDPITGVNQNEDAFAEWLQCLGLRSSVSEQIEAQGERIVAQVADWAAAPAGRATRRRLPRDLDAADFMQELCLCLLSRGRGTDLKEAYLQTAASNRMRSAYRSPWRQRRLPYPEDEAARERIEPVVEELADATPGLDLLALLADSLRPESYAFLLRVALDEESESAMGDQLAVDARTVRRWLSELRQALRQHSGLAPFAPSTG